MLNSILKNNVANYLKLSFDFKLDKYLNDSIFYFRMRKILILFNTLIFIFLINYPECNAEKLYLKDGRIISGEITHRRWDTVWIEYMQGSIGINISTIDRIDNDDGSISKYDYESLSNMIKNSIRQKDYNSATRFCSLLLESFPNNAQIRYLRGNLNQKVGNLKEAIQDYNFLIQHKVADAIIINNLGAIYVDQKEYQKAIELFTNAIEKNPNMAEAHNNLAELFLLTKNSSRAIEEYNKTIQLEPKNITALYNLGIVYMNNGDYPKAKEQWEKILALNPEDDDISKVLEYLKFKNNEVVDINSTTNAE